MKMKGWLIPFAALAISLCMSFAAEAADAGWVKDGDNWKWQNSSGGYETSVWKKGGDGEWRWLDGSGVMAVNSWADNDTYYVDDNGKIITDAWKQLTAFDDANNEYWYYFNNTGKLAKSCWKKTNDKWYHVGDDGRLEYGWILEDMYYTDENGVMLTGWQLLKDPDEASTTDANKNTPGSTSGEESDDTHYYYFNSSGKKYVPGDISNGDYGERKVDGKRYCFSSTGARQYGWVNLEGTDGVNQKITDYKYYNEDGTVRTGWYSLNPPDDMDSYYPSDVVWFYFNSSGVPYASESDEYIASDFLKIGSKKYLFNEYGTPVTGLKKVYTSSARTNYTAYYFGTDSQSCVQKGKISIKESDGTSYTYYFSDSSGEGYTGTRDGILYYMGKPQKADKDVRYAVISLPKSSSSDTYTNYVVNTSGKIEKKTTVKDKDSVKYTTDSSGILTAIDGETSGITGYFTSPSEPDFSTSD